MKKKAVLTAILAAAVAIPATIGASGDRGRDHDDRDHDSDDAPIRHVVVIFQENVSFDHYFATYPHAANTDGSTFNAKAGTPLVNGLFPGGLLDHNPNSAQPFRLSALQAATCDQDHNYKDEQRSFNAGAMNKFPETVGVGGPPCLDYGHGTGLVMGYYDGNTVTALWNYAQRFAMSDNSYSTTFGPSTPGALNLISGQTNGVIATLNGIADEVDGGTGSLTVIGDPDPIGDVCSNPTRNQVQMAGRNIGDLLNAAGVSWGSFMGGFNLTAANPNM